MRKTVFILVLLLLSYSVTSAQEAPVGYVLIPAIDVYQPIYLVPLVNHQYSEEALNRRVGWLEDTAWIHDGWATVVLAAHSYGKFADIDLLQTGDEVIVWDAAGAVTYHIVGRDIVPVTDISVLQPTQSPTLVLITCYGNDRLVIYAE